VITHDVEVLVIVPLAAEGLSRIAAVDPRVRVVDARAWFDGEIAKTWPRWTVERYLAQRPIADHSRQELDRVLAGAEIILGGWPFPAGPAGASAAPALVPSIAGGREQSSAGRFMEQ